MPESPEGESFTVLLAHAVRAVARRHGYDTVEALLQAAMRALQAIGGIVLLLTDHGELRVAAESGMPPDVLERFQSLGIASGVPVTDAVRFGQSVWIGTFADRDRAYPVMRDVRGASVASASVPIVVTDKVIGALAVGMDGEHAFTPDERAHLEAVADLCGIALERARTEEAARNAEERNRWAVSTLSEQFRLVGIERERAADEVRRRQLASIIDAMTEGVAVAAGRNDRGGATRFVIEYVNPAAGHVLGTDRTAIVGAALTDLPAGRALLDAASGVFAGELSSQLIVIPAAAGRVECTMTGYESGVVLLLRRMG